MSGRELFAVLTCARCTWRSIDGASSAGTTCTPTTSAGPSRPDGLSQQVNSHAANRFVAFVRDAQSRPDREPMLRNVTPDLIQRFLAHLAQVEELAPASANQARRCLGTMFNRAIHKGLMEPGSNPVVRTDKITKAVISSPIRGPRARRSMFFAPEGRSCPVYGKSPQTFPNIVDGILGTYGERKAADRRLPGNKGQGAIGQVAVPLSYDLAQISCGRSPSPQILPSEALEE
jgi:hypothetical protein